MDLNGFSQIGRYGTISLMKSREVDTIVTAFGVDCEEVTFGRDPGCSVRLYYPDVNLVHCKITFKDRKVSGIAQLRIDLLTSNHRHSSSSLEIQAYLSTIAECIPIQHLLARQPRFLSQMTLRSRYTGKDSVFHIHPKRCVLLCWPLLLVCDVHFCKKLSLMISAGRSRRLRLSMIHSAQVFTPRPSKDPQENLRILKSPVKNTFRSPAKPHTRFRLPATSNLQDAGEEEEEEANEIVLVDGNHPRVVEEDKDLVILEDIEVPMPPPVIHALPPKTPQRRRSQSLHRAVLIRSAQRRILEHDRLQQQENQTEEMESLDTVVNDDTNNEEDIFNDQDDRDEQENSSASDEETDSDEDEIKREDNQGQLKSLWRKSFEKLWPFKSLSSTDAQVLYSLAQAP